DGVLNAEAFTASPVVPQSVYVLIQSRLAQLSDAARRVLDAAVAAGREFEFEVVARAAGLSEGAALDALDELRAADLMAPLDGLRFTFNHTLTMEVAYREAGEPRHRMLHRRMAEALEALYHNRLDTVAGLLAWHYIEGNAPERAAPYAFRAGQLAAQLPAWKEAIGFFEQALQAETDRGRRREILMALGEAHFAAGGADPAVEAFRAALDLALADGGIGEVNAARLALARGLFGQARYAESITLAQTVLASGDSDNAMMAEFAWGSALSVEGADLVGAAEHLQKAGALCDGQADPLRLAQIKFDLGGVRAQQGDLVSAIALYRESLDAARAPLSLSKGGGPSALWQALAHNNLGYHLHLLNDPGALEHAQTGLALAEEGGIIPVKPYLLSTLGEIALARNDLDAAEAYFTEGLALAERISAPERITGLTANLGRVAARRGLTALAVHRLSTALARADALGLQHLAAQIRLWLVPLLPPAEARAHLAEARAIIVAGDRRLLMQPLADLEAGAS
ncbi:MAG: transcriptional regulator, partial [Chloroflexi bacterium]|nr:transcriptional regulator [Chloroflexota bacterium]